MLLFQQIISLCLKKDKKAEFALYKECHAYLLPICLRYKNNRDDALDLLNKGFHKILQGLETYDHNKSFEKWAKSILIYTIIDDYRKDRKWHEKVSLYDSTEEMERQGSFELNRAEELLTNKDILKEIQNLAEPSRSILNLYVFEGLTHEEIASHFNISVITSRWHLRNARLLLKQRLGESIRKKGKDK